MYSCPGLAASNAQPWSDYAQLFYQPVLNGILPVQHYTLYTRHLCLLISVQQCDSMAEEVTAFPSLCSSLLSVY